MIDKSHKLSMNVLLKNRAIQFFPCFGRPRDHSSNDSSKHLIQPFQRMEIPLFLFPFFSTAIYSAKLNGINQEELMPLILG